MTRALAMVTLLLATSAAQATSATAPAAAPAQTRRGGQPARRILRLDEVTVEGRIQKPQAFFILQRSQQSFEQLEKKESFLPKIVKSTEKDPF